MTNTTVSCGKVRFSHSMEQASPFFLHGQKDPPLVSQTANEPLKSPQRRRVQLELIGKLKVHLKHTNIRDVNARTFTNKQIQNLVYADNVVVHQQYVHMRSSAAFCPAAELAVSAVSPTFLKQAASPAPGGGLCWTISLHLLLPPCQTASQRSSQSATGLQLPASSAL